MKSCALRDDVVLRLGSRAIAWVWLVGMVFGGCLSVGGIDVDILREPVIRPDEETVKRWLFNTEIVMEKRSLWFDRKAKIDPSKILTLKVSGGSIFQKVPPLANYAITTRTFAYPDGYGKTNKYVVVIEYEWSATLKGVERKFVKVSSISGP